MKIVVQRSLKSLVKVKDKTVGEISNGLVLLSCLEKNDSKETVKKASEKILKLRIFKDENDRMNRSIIDIKGEILNISQFTLSWNGQKGNRPSFDNSMAPDQANELFEFFCSLLEDHVKVQKGVFGEHMDVQIHNDGPVTFFLEF